MAKCLYLYLKRNLPLFFFFGILKIFENWKKKVWWLSGWYGYPEVWKGSNNKWPTHHFRHCNKPNVHHTHSPTQCDGKSKYRLNVGKMNKLTNKQINDQMNWIGGYTCLWLIKMEKTNIVNNLKFQLFLSISPWGTLSRQKEIENKQTK